MRVLVSGGAGFIGSHICRRLVEEGHDVICLDNFDPYYDPRIKRENVEGLNVEVVQGSVTDLRLLRDLCRDVEVIYHEAAQAGVRASVENPIKPYEVNVVGTLNILVAARDGGVRRVINASSSSVYGRVQYLPFDEEHPTEPVSPYGASKLAAEYYCNVFQHVYGLETVNLRYFTVYGPRMRPDLAISIFTRAALKDAPIEIYGDGSKTRDFTYIDDVVDANIKIMKRGRGTYNIGGGNRISILELAKKIIEITRSKSKVTYSDNKEGDVEHTWADIKKAKRDLGWEPKVGIEEELKKTIECLRSLECTRDM